jgi:multicomponent Na+:H+ antiporter subunit F
MVFYIGIGWLAVLLGVIIVHAARSRSTAARILALDLLTLVLIGLLALSAGEDGRSFALDAALGLALLSFVATLAACRFHENRRPFT